MKKISQFLSFIFSPMLVPTYGMVLASFLSVLAMLPGRVLWTVISITFVLTCLVPMLAIYALYRSGRVSDPGLNDAKDRALPYVITMLSYLACGFFLYRVQAPMWLPMFFAGGAAAILVNLVINFRWKISGHAASMGGLVAMLFRLAASHVALYDMNMWISAAVVLTGCVMTARVYLGRHTLMQVFAGVANGFLCVWFMTMIH